MNRNNSAIVEREKGKRKEVDKSDNSEIIIGGIMIGGLVVLELLKLAMNSLNDGEKAAIGRPNGK